MKKKEILTKLMLGTFIGLFTVIFSPLFAQEKVEISDEEIRQYAIVMDSIDIMKAALQTEYNRIVKEDELMDGGRRYMEIEKVAGDPEKLAALNLTEEEKMAYDQIKARYNELVAGFKADYTTLIKEELGAAIYNKISKAIPKNPEVKAKYEEFLSQIQNEKKTDGDNDADNNSAVTD
jgi:hypothetical protein